MFLFPGDNVLNEVPEAKCAWWKKAYSSGAHNTSTPTLISTLDSLLGERRYYDVMRCVLCAVYCMFTGRMCVCTCARVVRIKYAF